MVNVADRVVVEHDESLSIFVPGRDCSNYPVGRILR